MLQVISNSDQKAFQIGLRVLFPAKMKAVIIIGLLTQYKGGELKLSPLQSVIRLATLFLGYTPPEMLFLPQRTHTAD